MCQGYPHSPADTTFILSALERTCKPKQGLFEARWVYVDSLGVCRHVVSDCLVRQFEVVHFLTNPRKLTKSETHCWGLTCLRWTRHWEYRGLR